MTIAIIGLLAMAGLPALGNYLANSKLREASNTFTSQAILARNEALKRNNSVIFSSDGATLSIKKVTGPNASTLIRSVSLPAGVVSDTFTATFDSAGLLAPFGTTATTKFSLSGKACSQDITCPAVRIDSGGSVKLCATGTCQ